MSHTLACPSRQVKCQAQLDFASAARKLLPSTPQKVLGERGNFPRLTKKSLQLLAAGLARQKRCKFQAASAGFSPKIAKF
jgi:hypothetical protein